MKVLGSIPGGGSIWKILKKKSKSCKNASRRWRTVFDFGSKEDRIQKIEELMQDPSLWEEQDRGAGLLKEAAELKRELALLKDVKKRIADVEELGALLKEGETEELKQQIDLLSGALLVAELQIFLSGRYDKGSATLTITAGAGGQDAQDWATMLYRMYTRYADRKEWDAKEIAHSFGEAGSDGRNGTKQVTFEVQGRYAYGLLKREAGVHRLVRISPFSAKELRHTSFASLEVLPVLKLTDEKDIVILPDDIRVDTFRASGPGGQYVNKRETAIRITHLKTGIVTSSQTQRSLQQNKDKALSMLAAKLYERKKEEEEKEKDALRGERKAIEWGSQVRSYVLQPYQLVKDHRTQTESKNVEAVLDGDIDVFIENEVKGTA
ncbi:MAG: peptide chain release factor 2 [bacterium]|nr:peptide chain release factor 2 [bacterium]